MRFLITHGIEAGCTPDKIDELLKLSQTDPDVRGYRSFMNLTEGRGVCVFDSPDHDRLVRWLDEHEMEYDHICVVELEAERGNLVDIPTITPAVART